MQDQKELLLAKIQETNNILVTVSNNPSVDQLAACIGLTLMLNKLEKHATAVFSGDIPSTIEFLHPKETIEKDTNSLRDFIISLDKSKADKLRYKVEDKVVKIFITPYRTSLSVDDLEFSQGDFNVDLIIALGVQQQSELDFAITAHGRILHDATIACINTNQESELGQINWRLADASSLSELVTELAKSLDKPVLDAQISTALLTGIVAETDRFKNDKTTPVTMSLSSDLMTAGANQHLVADELEHAIKVQGNSGADSGSLSTNNEKSEKKDIPEDNSDKPKNEDGTLEISHGDKPKDKEKPELPAPVDEGASDKTEANSGNSQDSGRPFLPPTPLEGSEGRLIADVPILGSPMTANSIPEDQRENSVLDPISAGNTSPDQSSMALLDREESSGSYTPIRQQDMHREKVIAPPEPSPAAQNFANNLNSFADSGASPSLKQFTPPNPSDWNLPSPTPPPQVQPLPPPEPIIKHEPSAMSSGFQTQVNPNSASSNGYMSSPTPVFNSSFQPPVRPTPASAFPPPEAPAPSTPPPPTQPTSSPGILPPPPMTPPAPAAQTPAPPRQEYSLPPAPTTPTPQMPPMEPSLPPSPAPSPQNFSPAPSAPQPSPAPQYPDNRIPEAAPATESEVEAAREAVMKALNEQDEPALPPVQALNALPIELNKPLENAKLKSSSPVAPLPLNKPDAAPLPNSPADQPMTMPLPVGVNLPPPQTTPPTNTQVQSPNSPPPVPPPMMPPNFK